MSSKIAIGTKGSDVYTAEGVGQPLVALSALLVRGADVNAIEKLMGEICDSTSGPQDHKKWIEDLIVLTFQTRDVRGGKGERELFKKMLGILFKSMPHLTLSLLDLIPEYGCWDDLFSLKEPQQIERVLEITVEQLLNDSATEDEGKISLCAKWAPREDRQGDLAKLLAKKIFPGEQNLSRRLKAYRKLVVGLNKRLQTTEINMSDQHFAAIEPGKVPGRCLQKHMKAFLNETLKSSRVRGRHDGLRSDDDDRMECRKNFQEHFAKAAKGEAKLNGSKTVFPHELIKKAVSIMHRRVPNPEEDPSEDEKNAILGVWRQMVVDAKAAGGLGRSIAMCDFSGSMASGSNGDTPYWVSMAMGLLISEVTTEEFKDTFLTFDSQPKMHVMRSGSDLFERLHGLENLGQGLSTDFQAAMDLVLSQIKMTRCRPGHEPENLIVLTDMNWDQACGSNELSYYTGNSYRHVAKTNPWQTHVEMIRESFKRAGEDMWGVPLKMPRIVIWNIASTSVDFHAQADTEGVVMLSGWSLSLFKALQSGEEIKASTPLEALRVQLDNERYDPVRERVRKFFA